MADPNTASIIQKHLVDYNKMLMCVVERNVGTFSLATIEHWVAKLSAWISLDEFNPVVLHLFHTPLDLLRDEYWRRVRLINSATVLLNLAP